MLSNSLTSYEVLVLFDQANTAWSTESKISFENSKAQITNMKDSPRESSLTKEKHFDSTNVPHIAKRLAFPSALPISKKTHV